MQGFSERLVTASRPAIGLMFKQVVIHMLCFMLLVLHATYGYSFNLQSQRVNKSLFKFV